MLQHLSKNHSIIQEATKNNKNIDGKFCLGLLAKNIKNIGITTVIERNPSKDEDS